MEDNLLPLGYYGYSFEPLVEKVRHETKETALEIEIRKRLEYKKEEGKNVLEYLNKELERERQKNKRYYIEEEEGKQEEEVKRPLMQKKTTFMSPKQAMVVLEQEEQVLPNFYSPYHSNEDDEEDDYDDEYGNEIYDDDY